MPLSADRLCTVTAHFVDASGADRSGVVVRFTPTGAADRRVGTSFVAQEVSAESDAAGALTITLIRGMRGTMSATGLPMFREVEVPDQAAVDLFELIAGAPDPLSPHEILPTTLPRRS